MAATSNDIADRLARVALKDRAAFRALYDDTSAKLFGVALRLLKQRPEAEEALQEIYVKIWERAGRYRHGDYSPMSWLIAIARNHCLDILRARKPVAEDIDEAFDIADAGPNPEQATLASAERARIDNCLDQLEPERADAVRGAYLDGYAYQELADRHDVPINTMRTWLRRSLMRLKDCLTA